MSRFIDSLRDQLQDALATRKPLFLFGDMNLDVSRPDSRGVAAYNALLSELSLQQLANEPTHLLPTPTILDHVVTNLPDTRASVQVLREAVGDHQPVTCSVALPRIRLKPECEIRRWDQADWSAICLDMLLADWEPMIATGNVNDKLDEFMLIWDTVLDRHCRTVRTRLAPPGCPWLRDNPELQGYHLTLNHFQCQSCHVLAPPLLFHNPDIIVGIIVCIRTIMFINFYHPGTS